MKDIIVVYTGLNEDSTSKKLAYLMGHETQRVLNSYGLESEVEYINIRQLSKDLTNMMLTGLPSSQVENAFRTVKDSDGVINVSPIYKATPIGLSMLFWQLIEDESLRGTPVLLGANGGTVRHSVVIESTLRPLMSYLKGLVLPSSVFASTDDWASADMLNSRVRAGAKELADSLRIREDKVPSVDPLDHVIPLRDLMGR